MVRRSVIHVGARGFEPPTSWSQTTRSTKLSYAPKSLNFNCLSLTINCLKISFSSVPSSVIIGPLRANENHYEAKPSKRKAGIPPCGGVSLPLVPQRPLLLQGQDK